MPVTFNQVPATQRVPWTYVEFDPSRAIEGPRLKPFKGLLVGQMLTGLAAAGTLVRITSEDDAAQQFGRGSLLHAQARAWYAQQRSVELWVYPLADGGGWVKATSTLTLSGTATEAGSVILHIAGRRYAQPVQVGGTAAALQSSLIAAIQADADRLVDASAGSGTNVTLTARNGGEPFNGVKVVSNYYQGERTPAGLTVGVADFAGGVGAPALAPLFAAMGDEQFDVLAFASSDAATLAAVDVELVNRFGPTEQTDGIAFYASALDFGLMTTFSALLNSPHQVLASSHGSPTPAFQWAAALASIVAFNAQSDPARPFQTLPMREVLAAKAADRWTQQERNLALFDGVTTHYIDPSGQVHVERVITTYQSNASGQPDTAYLDANTVLTLSFLRWSFRNFFAQRYPRHKLAKTAAGLPPGLDILTPISAKAAAVAWFQDMQTLGLVEDPERFKSEMVVEVNATDPNRLDFLLTPDLINQLRITAAKIQFRL